MIIYKITNLINGKIYIGKTNNFSRRRKEHFNSNYNWKEKNKVLYIAMKKYKLENFKMEIVEECENSEWEEREKYWISFYNSLLPNGYNMVDGGHEPPHYKGEKSPVSKLDMKAVKEIKYALKNYKTKELSIVELSKLYNISIDQISRINKGISWEEENENYPLRKSYSTIEESKEIKEILKTWEYTCEEISQMYDKSISAIKAINSGQNFFDKMKSIQLNLMV